MPTGILSVAYPLRERARAALPPDHRIIAIKDEGTLFSYEQWMIEGPMMPGGAMPVQLMTMLLMDDDMSMVVKAKFKPAAVGYEDVYWIVDRWPDLDAFRAAHDLEPL